MDRVGREAVLIILGLGLVFGLGSLFLHEVTLKFFCLGFGFGSFCGFAVLPFIDDKKWKPMPLTCSVLAMLGALAFALLSGWSPGHTILLAIGGAAVGYFAPYWAQHM